MFDGMYIAFSRRSPGLGFHSEFRTTMQRAPARAALVKVPFCMAAKRTIRFRPREIPEVGKKSAEIKAIDMSYVDSPGYICTVTTWTT